MDDQEREYAGRHKIPTVTVTVTRPVGEPAVPARFTPDDDVNPICGCHKRSMCLGCGGCTSCDACYCDED